MNKTLLVHGTWLVVASCAFVIGYRMFPAHERNAVSSGLDRSSVDGGGLLAGGRTTVGMGVTADGQSGLGQASLSGRDIDLLGEMFRTAASPIERRLGFSKLLEGLSAENALQIREQIAHMDHRSSEFREFHYAWGAVAGEEAALFGASTKEDDMSPALAGWANADPNAALAWFKNLDMANDPRFDSLLKERKLNEANLRQHLMVGLVQGLANADPTMASEVIGEVAQGPHDRSAHRMMHTVVESVLRTNKPAGAVQWAEALPEGQSRNLAMSRVADRYADEDPQAAASWAESYTDNPENANVVGEVGHSWAAKDPNAAVDWVTSLPDSPGKHAGMHRALHQWADNDPAAASEYLATLPDSGVKNAAVSGFSRRLAWEDPQAAITWAGTISSEKQRADTMIGVGHAWMRKDEAAARDWALSAGLPENVQQAILNPKRGR